MFLPTPAPIGSPRRPARPDGARTRAPHRRPSRARHRAETPRPRWFRGVALLLAVLIPASGVALGSTGIAQAAVVQWGSGSNQAPNYQATVNGDFTMAGNGVLACSGSALTATGTSGSCADLHANTPGTGVTTSYNDYFKMTNSNTVSGFTTNSSSATLTIPAGATVAKAFLSWSANTGAFTGTSNTTCSANSGSGSQWYATRPDASAGYRSQPVQLKVGSGAIASVAPGTMLEDPTSQSTALYYSAGADVTSAFSGATTGSPLTVSAGNIWAAVGAGCYAGWSLTVVYDYGKYIPGNQNSAPHRVIYYEGHVREAASDSPLTVQFSGFSAIASGAKFGYTLFEGDRGITGDSMTYTPQGGSATNVLNAQGASGNIGISQADGSVRYTSTSDTSTFTNASVDVHTETLAGVSKGDTSMTLTVGTSGDSYLLRNAVLSVPTAAISVSKTLDGTKDDQYRTATENTASTIAVTNNGSVSLSNIQLTFPDAETCTGGTTIPGPLAVGATTTVQCTGPPPTAASTTSSVTATGQVTSDPSLTVSDTDTTNTYLSAIALTKTAALASGATGRAGDTVNYNFTATNTGTDTLTGVSITDPLKGLSALTYGTWPSGTAGTLAPGAAVTATATYTLTQTDVDAGSVANTASTVGTDADGGPQPTATASRTLTLGAANGLTLTKSGTLSGGTVTWSFRLTNSGAQTVTGAAITDQLTGVSGLTYGTWPSGTVGRLAPGQSVTATATSSVTQAQTDAGSVTNTATASGTSASGAAVTAPVASATVALPASPALTLTKTGALASGSTGRVGDTVTWSFALRNSGNVTITSAAITDRLAGVSAVTIAWPGTAGTLAPGATATGTATYSLTQTDVDAGSVVNTAGASGTAPSGAAVTAPTATATVAVVDASQLTITKDGALAPGSTGRAGDTVNWNFTVTNNGNTTLSGVTVADPLAGISAITYGTWTSGTTGKLLPGGSVTATATSTLTQAQVDAGSITNTATASGTRPSGTAVTSGQATKTVSIAAAQRIALTKTGALASGSTGAVGDTVTWSFSATNTGNQTLTGVTVADGLAGVSTPALTWPGTAGTLAPGATVTGTATYKLTQADVDAGSVVNTATASGTNPTGAAASSTSSATVAVSRAPGIAITKTGALASGSTGAVGDTVTYTLTVRNSGNTTLTGVAVTDPLAGLSSITYGTWPGTSGRLTAGQSVTATATYRLSQKDVDAGYVANTATARGTAPDGSTATNAASARVTVPTSPAITVAKTGALAAGATGAAGDTVNYTFTARNTGDQTLTGVTMSDALIGVSTLTYGTWASGTAGTLAPGQTETATATYVLSQSDVDAGSVVNTARVSATTPAQTTIGASSPNTLPIPSSGTLSFSKTGALATGATGRAGDTVRWSFTLRNTGNVTLTGAAITDQLSGLSAITYSWPGSAGRLAPGQSATATATSALTQAQVDAGTVGNSATATATTPSNTAVTQTATASVPVTRTPAISVAKSGALASGSTGAVGDTVTWTLRITDTGTTTLTGVGASDTLAGMSSLSFGTWPGTSGTLTPGQSVTATATSTLNQSDLDAGAVTNTATATGTGPGNTGTVTGQGSGTVPLATSPMLGFTKRVATNPGWTGRAGDTLTYTFQATNTGNQTLTGVTIADPHAGLGTLTYSWPATAGTLAPGRSVTATATYAVTQADVDAGSVANRATVTGTTPAGTTVSTSASASQTIAPAPGIAVAKSAVVGGTGRVGDTVTYRFDVTDTGTTTLTGVGVTDPLNGLSAITYGTWPSGTAGTLAPGQTVRGTATYVLTQADVDAGSVVNTATASGTAPSGTTVSGTGSATVRPATASPTIGLTKTERLATNATGIAGDTVRLGYTITNTGNQTLGNVTLTDAQSGHAAFAYGVWPGAAGTLAPGQSVTATSTYVLTQADVDAGGITSTATTTGVSPGNVTVRSSADGSVSTTRTPAIALTEAGAVTSGSGGVDSVVTWTYTATNTGTVTLTGDAVTHSLPGNTTVTWPGAAGTLAPGQSLTATATSTLTQSDVDAGSVVDTSSVTGTAPSGVSPTTVTATSAATVRTSNAAPSLGITKTETFHADASTTRAAAAGDTVDMRYAVTNTGNVTLTVVGVTDAQNGISSVQFDSTHSGITTVTLAPGASATAYATYTLSQSDVDAGGISSAATAFGTTPAGTKVTATASAGVVVTPSAAITLTKSAHYGTSSSGAVESGKAGDTVVYAFTATNTGSVTLSGIGLRDALLGLTSRTPITGTPTLTNVEWSGGTAGTLAPGERVRAQATYTVTQPDVDHGSITNSATVSGTTPAGATSSGDGAVTIATDAANTAAIGIVKTATASTTAAAVGDTVRLGYTVTNTGDFTLTGVTLTDTGADSGSIAFASWPGDTARTLAPGATVTATATHTVTQADIDRGYVSSPATTTGTPANGGADVTATGYRSVPLVQTNDFSFVKTGAAHVTGKTGVGDVIDYTLTATNTGNTTLDLLQMTDRLQGVGALTYSWPDSTDPGTVRPGEHATATASYTISQADVDAGAVVNTADAVASPPTGPAVTKTTSTSGPALDTAGPAIRLQKTEQLAGGSAGIAGDTVRLGYTITNTGATTLTGVTVADAQSQHSTITYAAWPSGTTGTLAPGQSVTATATYTLTQADVDRAAADTDGHTAVSSSATATGTDRRAGGTVTDTASGAVTLTPTSSIATRKTAVTVGGGDIAAVRAGDVVRYTVTATNTGQTTLTGVTVADPIAGLGTPTTTWPTSTAGTLAPGQAVVVTADRTVTQSDVDAGSIANTATTTGVAPDGTTVSGSGTRTVVTTTGAPTIDVVKQEALAAGSTGTAGDTVDLTFTITNTGDVTLSGVAVTDTQARLGTVSYDPWPGGRSGTLAPGASVVAHATTTLTQADVDAGGTASTATATGTPPRGATVSDTDDGGVVVAPHGAMTVTKTGTLADGGTGRVGDRIDFTFTVANTGNVTLSGVGIDDVLRGVGTITYANWPTTTGRLAPGQSVTGTASYRVTQGDVDAGSVANQATGSARTPAGDIVTATGAATVPLAAAAPGIRIQKTETLADGATGVAGDTVRLGYTVTNTGTATLSGVTLADAQPGASAIAFGTWPGTVGTLAPGESVTASATVRLTQADVDAGRIGSSASTSGVDPHGTTVGDTASASLPLTAAAGVGLTKTASLPDGGTGRVGDRIAYVFTVTNTGQVTLSAPTITDRLAGLGTITTASGPNGDGTLAPGQSLTATAGYVVTQDDVDSGSVVNTADVTATPARGDAVTATASTTTPTSNAAPAIGLAKTETLHGTGTQHVGDTVDLGWTITNTGNQTLVGVTVADQQTGLGRITYGTWPSGTAGVLAPGQSVSATASYALTQADLDRGTVGSDATTTGTTRSGTPVSATAHADQAIAAVPAMSFTKTGALAAGATGRVGEAIDYDFTVTNTGNVTLSLLDITDAMRGVSDPSVGTWPGQVGVVAPGQSVAATATYTIRQSDVDAGSVTNAATATAQAPDGTVVTQHATATVETAASGPRIGIAKSAALAPGAVGVTGDRVDDTYTITNTGNVTLTGVGLTDDQRGVTDAVFGSWPSTAGTLAPGESVTATAHTVLTQADVDRGSLPGTATTAGTGPGGTGVTASDATTVVIPPAPAIDFTKTAAYTGDGTGRVGDTVRYTFRAMNTGTVTLSGVTITDQLAGLSTPTSTWPGTAGTLAPGETVTATATRTVTQADVDAGSIVNRATVTANPPTGAPITAQDSAAVTTAPTTDGIALTKDERITSGRGVAGDTVTLTFTITNDGDRTLHGITLADDQPGLSTIAYGTWPGTTGTLAPGESVTATATTRLTQADVDGGGTASRATTEGTTPGGDTVRATATGQVASVRDATLTLDKRATGGAAVLGDTVDYTYAVTNTGTVTLTGIAIADALPGLSPIAPSWPASAGVLAPGQTATATAAYTVTQSDVDAGSVVNTASATGTAPSGVTAPAPATDSATVVLAPAAQSIGVTKTEALANAGHGDAGDAVALGYRVTNTGTRTLHDVGLADAQTGVSPIAFGDWPGTPGTLAPGQSVAASASVTLTQADVDAGSVSSTVTATGTAPNGAVVTDTAAAGVTVAARPSIALTESGALAPGATGAVGDRVVWSVTVRNDGNVTLDATAVRAALPGAFTLGPWPGADGVLAPGQAVTGTTTTTITQAQFDAGTVRNPATATGTAPSGATVHDDATAAVATGPADARIGIVKTAALPDGDTAPAAGDTATFTYAVTNTGTSTLTGVTIADTQTGLSGITAATWPSGTEGTLAPGQTVTATATHRLTQAEVDAGSIASPATATGTPPSGADVTARSSATLVLPPSSSIGIVKTGRLAGGAGAPGALGDTVDYRVVVTNTGTTTLYDVAVTDRLPGLGAFTVPDGFDGALAPGDSVTETATYTVTQDDVDAGQVVNEATATANPPTGAPVTATDSATVGLGTATPAIGIVKDQHLAAGATGRAGDTVDYTFTVTNRGATTLTGVTIADGQSGLSAVSITWPGAAGTLRPGQTATGTATHTLTQDEVDAGSVSSTATTSGTSPSGTVVTATDTGTTAVSGTPSLSVAKRGALAGGGSGAGGSGLVGDRVEWTVTVTNTGAVTLHDVTITDTLAGYTVTGTDWPAAGAGAGAAAGAAAAGVLAPGESVVEHGTSTLTQADVDAGRVVNTARATGAGPSGTVASASGAATVATGSATPGITLTKTATWAPGSTGVAGDTVLFHYVVTNGGGSTLRGVAIQDAQQGLSTITYSWPGDPGVLAPGQTVTADATYVATQQDIDAGTIGSPATVIGIAPGGDPVEAHSDAGVDVPTEPHLTLTKTASLPTGTTGVVGDTITYTFTVVNDGNATMTDVGVHDDLPGLSALTWGTWPGDRGTLQPFEQVTATATRMITQADVDAGGVVNTATASGTGPAGTFTSAPAAATTTLGAHGALAITKTVQYAAGTDGASGQDLEYGFTIVNTGTVTVTGVRVDDELAGLGTVTYGAWPGTDGMLAPGQRVTASADYRVDGGAAARGSVANTATASGSLPDGDQVVSMPSTVTIPVHPAAVSGLPGAVLAFTGSTPGIPIGIGAMLVALGLVLTVLGSRRRTRKEHR